MPYITPDQAAVRYSVCRRLLIPVEYLHIVAGALSELLMPRNWETRGDIAAEQALSEMYTMWLDYGEDVDCMIGTLIDYVTATPPQGVLLCDGMAYSRVDYPVLYSRLDTAYIVDADTFQVPDLRGRVRVSSGDGTGLTSRVVATAFGTETHILTIAELPSHNHIYDKTVVATSVVLGELPGLELGDYFPTATSNEGGGEAHNNIQPSYVVHTGIVAR